MTDESPKSIVGMTPISINWDEIPDIAPETEIVGVRKREPISFTVNFDQLTETAIRAFDEISINTRSCIEAISSLNSVLNDIWKTQRGFEKIVQKWKYQRRYLRQWAYRKDGRYRRHVGKPW